MAQPVGHTATRGLDEPPAAGCVDGIEEVCNRPGIQPEFGLRMRNEQMVAERAHHDLAFEMQDVVEAYSSGHDCSKMAGLRWVDRALPVAEPYQKRVL